MRVVLDTNILVSALIAPAGNPAAIYNAWDETGTTRRGRRDGTRRNVFSYCLKRLVLLIVIGDFQNGGGTSRRPHLSISP
jgi:hypothetical protein